MHELADPWPSMGDMALSGKNVVIFVEMEYERIITELCRHGSILGILHTGNLARRK